MKNKNKFFFLALLTVLATAGCSKEPPTSASDPKPANQKPEEYAPVPNALAGEKVFDTECLVCHGPRGQKSMSGMKKDAANLASEKIQKMSDVELKKTIRKGKQDNPEMAGHPWLTEDEINSLILYIRSLKK